MNILPSPEIWHRDDFPMLCEWRKLYRIVEVGVDRADFSGCFWERCYNCQVFVGVDPYEPYAGMPWDRESDFLIAVKRFAEYPRGKLLRQRSCDAAKSLKMSDADLYSVDYDFVYIDGGHQYEDVVSDLQTWWPIVSQHGIIAGHDWDMKTGDHDGVRRAVTEFAEKLDLTVYFTPDDPASWYIYKSGIPGADWRRVQ